MSQKNDKSQTQPWWQTLPGIMTAMGAIITALTGLLIALNQAGVIGVQGNLRLKPTKLSPRSLSRPRPYLTLLR